MAKADEDILGAVHGAARDLHAAGLLDDVTMRDFDAACLPPVKTYTPEEIQRIRLRNRVSQPVFAAYLNVSKTSVAGWESGAKKPGPAAMKLLNIVDRKGLDAVA